MKNKGNDSLYSKNLNNRQTLAGFVDNYDLIYKIMQKKQGKSKTNTAAGARSAPVGRGRRPRHVVVFVFAIFAKYFLGFGQVFCPFTCPSMDKLVFPMITGTS